MTSILELNEIKVPIVRIDNSMNKYSHVVLFPEKVEKAKETIAKIGLRKNKSTDPNKILHQAGLTRLSFNYNAYHLYALPLNCALMSDVKWHSDISERRNDL